MKNLRFAAYIAILALCVSACQIEEQGITPTEVAEPCQITCTMSATMPEFKAGGDPETKSSLESVVRVRWKKDDELSVINLTTGKQLGGCIKADADGANSTFSPSGLHGSITAGDKLVFLLDNDPSRRSANEKDFEPFTLDYSSQKGNANEVPIVVYANYTATENGTINAVNPEFNFLMGYVQLAVAALPASTSVTELGIDNLNTKCHFSINNHEFVTTPQNGNITLSEAFNANSKGANTRYFSCFTSPAQGTARNAHICANSLNHITAWLKAALSAGYYYQSVATGFTNENISFVDDAFKGYCVSHYDKNGDGEISFAEAAAVTSFVNFTAAEKSSIKEVFELPYFFKGERIPNFEGCTALKQVILPGTLQNIQANAFKGCTGLEVITIPSTVTTIGEGAFEGCTSLARFDGAYASTDRRYIVRDNHVLAFAPAGLTETTIPDGVTTINAGVFANNTSLKTVNLSAQLTTVEARAFKGCTALPIIRFRTAIAIIGEDAFKGCSALRSVYSDAVTPPTIGTDAFANCHASLAAHVTAGNLAAYEANAAWSALSVSSGQPWNEIWYTTTDGEKINGFVFVGTNGIIYGPDQPSNTYVDGKGILFFNKDCLFAGGIGFRNSTTLETISFPACTQSIGYDYCRGCTSLTSVTLPESLQSLGDQVFLDCSSLTSITLPLGLQSIGYSAFLNCSSLTSITLPQGLLSIGYQAFQNCSSLTSVSFPQGLQSIGDNAFDNCSSLTSVTLLEGLKSLGATVFSDCSSLATITLPQGLETIGWGAFIRTSLSSITLPEGIQSVGVSLFSQCSSLTSITLPEDFLSIPNGTFSMCSSLTSITLPQGIQSIGNDAFSWCANLTSIYINSTTPPSIGTSVLDISPNAFFYVPTASVDVYKDAWPDYASKISGYSF
ncbi:MAG: leucine-rich repeat domain-containing protein [Bacteroidales bacterium]|nr:leucine-rich repeat domain-containing protein [Bacteroidales bacterium]